MASQGFYELPAQQQPVTRSNGFTAAPAPAAAPTAFQTYHPGGMPTQDLIQTLQNSSDLWGGWNPMSQTAIPSAALDFWKKYGDLPRLNAGGFDWNVTPLNAQGGQANDPTEATGFSLSRQDNQESWKPNFNLEFNPDGTFRKMNTISGDWLNNWTGPLAVLGAGLGFAALGGAAAGGAAAGGAAEGAGTAGAGAGAGEAAGAGAAAGDGASIGAANAVSDAAYGGADWGAMSGYGGAGSGALGAGAAGGGGGGGAAGAGEALTGVPPPANPYAAGSYLNGTNLANLAGSGMGEFNWTSLIGPALSAASSLYGASQVGKASDAQVQAADRAMQMFQPWINAGGYGINRLATMLGREGPDAAKAAFQIDPGYQFRLDQGMQGLQRAASATGGLGSGKYLKDAMAYNQGQASQEFGNSVNRLLALSGMGQTATGSSADYATQGANARAAGLIGQANAINNGIGQGYSMYENNRLMNALLPRTTYAY